MKKRITYINILLVLCLFAFSACIDKDYRTVFATSQPVIESQSLSATSVIYGDSITLTAKVSDPQTPLSTLVIVVTSDSTELTRVTIRTVGQSCNVVQKIGIPYIAGITDGKNLSVKLILTNVEGTTAVATDGLIGNIKPYSKLYLVKDDGTYYEMLPNGNFGFSTGVINEPNKINYKIATALTVDNKIDYSSVVWGSVNGTTQVGGVEAGYIFANVPLIKSTDSIWFNTSSFTTTLMGQPVENVSVLSASKFSATTISNQAFMTQSFYIEANKVLTIAPELQGLVFNPDFFERTAVDQVKFLGAAGIYTLDYSTTMGAMLVEDLNAAYPDYLLITGTGVGYASTLGIAHTSWGFGDVLQYILCPKISDGVYQSTVYLDPANLNFKYFENNGWGNEKASDDYTLPSILMNSGGTDGNWHASTTFTTPGFYKLTIDLNTQVVTAVSVTIP